MAILINQSVNIPTGTRQFSVNIPNGLTAITVQLARMTAATPTLWTNPATTLNMNLSLSLDGGQSFNFYSGFSAQGGAFIGKGGIEIPYSSMTFNLPAGASRRAQVEIIVENGPLVSNVAIEAL